MNNKVTALKTSDKRTTGSFRDVLFNELDLLREGSISTKRARATAAIAREILASARIELDSQRLALEYELEDSEAAKPALSL